MIETHSRRESFSIHYKRMLETLSRRENHTRVRSTRQMTRVLKRHARTHFIELSEQASKLDKAGPQNYRVAKERIIDGHSHPLGK